MYILVLNSINHDLFIHMYEYDLSDTGPGVFKILAYDSSYQKVLLKLMAVEYGPRIMAMGKEPFALVCQLSTNDCIIA
jgi:hypothetical protein